MRYRPRTAAGRARSWNCASYSPFHIAQRLLELLTPVTSGAGHEEAGDDGDEHDGADEDAFVDEPDDHEELVHLLRWLKTDRFDRRAAYGELAQLTMGGVA